MNDNDQFRMERIEKLLHELRYEITRGMMEGEIHETMGMRWMVPTSKTFPEGVVLCEFNTRPVPRFEILAFGDKILQPRLTVVK